MVINISSDLADVAAGHWIFVQGCKRRSKVKFAILQLRIWEYTAVRKGPERCEEEEQKRKEK